MADIQKIAQAASRACEDPAFAREILEGKQDYPEVRDAILKDLAVTHQEDAQEAGGSGGRLTGLNVARLSERAKSW